MYFSSFPKIDYDVKGDGITTRMTDITRRARISDQSVMVHPLITMISKILRGLKILPIGITEILSYIGLS